MVIEDDAKGVRNFCPFLLHMKLFGVNTIGLTGRLLCDGRAA